VKNTTTEGKCDCCGRTAKAAGPVHGGTGFGQHFFMLAKGWQQAYTLGEIPALCLACAASNPDEVIADDCRDCCNVLALVRS